MPVTDALPPGFPCTPVVVLSTFRLMQRRWLLFKCRWLYRQLHRAKQKAAKQQFSLVSVCTERPQPLGKHGRRKCFLHDILRAVYNQHPSSAAALDKPCQQPESPLGLPVSRVTLKQSCRDKTPVPESHWSHYESLHDWAARLNSSELIQFQLLIGNQQV